MKPEKIVVELLHFNKTQINIEDSKNSMHVLAKGSKSFHFASLFLPKLKRKQAAELYAFCRHVDDIADGPGEKESKKQKLEEMQSRVNGQPYRAHLIKGALLDLESVFIQDEEELVKYAYYVAGSVGRMMCSVLNVTSSDAEHHAVHLGIAMQLTNIARDVVEDAKIDRVYLPKSWFKSKDDLSPKTIAEHQETKWVAMRILDLAEAYYESGRAGLKYIPLRSRLGIAVAARVYQAIGYKLQKKIHKMYNLSGYPSRVSTSVFEKMKAVFYALVDLIYAEKISTERVCFLSRHLVSDDFKLTKVPVLFDSKSSIPAKFVAAYFEKDNAQDERMTICLHGWNGDHHAFDSFKTIASEQNQNILVLDLPGSGVSNRICRTQVNKQTDKGVNQLIEPVLELIDRYPLHRIALIGNCSGALLSLELIKQRPMRIERAVLIEPYLKLSLGFFLLSLPYFGPIFFWSAFQNTLGRKITQFFVGGLSKKDMKLLDGFKDARHRELMIQLRAFVGIKSIKKYNALEERLIFIFGKKSFKSPAISESLVQELFPGSKQIYLEDAGHLLLQETSLKNRSDILKHCWPD